MPRNLWLGLIVCALGLLALLVLVRTSGSSTAIDPLVEHAVEPSDPPRAALIGSTEAATVERVAIATASEPRPGSGAEGADRKSRSKDRSHADFGVGERLPQAFESGVIEVRVVRDHDGQAMGGVNVALESDWGSDLQTTDSGGTVVFLNVVQGRSSLTAILAGHARAVGEAWIARETPHSTVELRLVVERDVVVRLRDPRGQPFEPAAWHLDRRAASRIGIRLDSLCGRLGSTFEAVDVLQYSSRSTEHDLGAFTWRVRIQRATDVCVQALLDDVIIGAEPLDAQATELHVRLDPAAIDAALAPVLLRVLAEVQDVPIAGALVEFDGGGSNLPSFHTGLDGRVRVSMAAAPSPQLVVIAGGYARTRFSLTRPYPPEFVVRLPPGRRIAGRVVDQDGSPLARALVECRDATQNAAGSRPLMWTRKDGAFEFEEVAPAEYRVLATFSGNRVELLADCRAGDALGLELKITVSKPALVPAAR